MKSFVSVRQIVNGSYGIVFVIFDLFFLYGCFQKFSVFCYFISGWIDIARTVPRLRKATDSCRQEDYL